MQTKLKREVRYFKLKFLKLTVYNDSCLIVNETVRICCIEEKIFAAIFDHHFSLVNQLIFVSMFRDVCTCDITKRFTIQKVQCNFWLRIPGEVLDEVDGLVWFQLHVFCEIRSGCVVVVCDALNGFSFLKKLREKIQFVFAA